MNSNALHSQYNVLRETTKWMQKFLKVQNILSNFCNPITSKKPLEINASWFLVDSHLHKMISKTYEKRFVDAA